MKKILASVLSSFFINHVNADCFVFAQFNKDGESYTVEKVSPAYLDAPSVLYVKYRVSNNTIVEAFIPKPFTDKGGYLNHGLCTPVNNTHIHPQCEGIFVTTNGATATALHAVAGALTLGLFTAATGGSYKAEPNEEAIKEVQTHSNFFVSPVTQNYLAGCKQYEINQDKIQQEKTQQLAIIENKEQEQLKLAQADKLAQLEAYNKKEQIYEQKFRATIKQGSETNCGTVIETKGIMAHVQTGGDAGSIWIKKDYLAPTFNINSQYIACSDNNRTYRLANGAWTLQNK